MKFKMHSGIAILFLAGLCFGQINLTGFNSRDVRQGYSVSTSVDSLLLETRVNSGTAVTLITFVLRPDQYFTNRDGINGQSLDSIEITLSFRLPEDFVADSMWLWIDGEPVEAFIQGSAAASAQYNNIVGGRLDPALLQYSGNGYYSLRLFPSKSLESRKIAIQFNHTFDDDSRGMIAANIPVTRSLTPGAVKHISATFKTLDHFHYNLDFPGFFSGNFSFSRPLTFTFNNVDTFPEGKIYCKDPSKGDEFLWQARDSRSGKLSAGITTVLSAEELLGEPETRIIVLDVKNQNWDWDQYYRKRAIPKESIESDPWLRACKLAILCLKSYVNENHNFNIIFPGPEGNLFAKPLPGTPENINEAIRAILTASGSAHTSTLEMLERAIEQDRSGVVILISNLIDPYNYNQEYIDAEEEFNSQISAIYSLVESSEITLFTMTGLQKLWEIAIATGGHNLADFRLRTMNTDGSCPCLTYDEKEIAGVKTIVPRIEPLFSTTREIRDLNIISRDLDDLVCTFDESNGLRTIIYDNSSRMLLRIAGQSEHKTLKERVKFTISGKVNGLRFSKEIDAVPFKGTQLPQNDVQWAFRKASMEWYNTTSDKHQDLKELGKEYHIVTPRTSLIALEPGIELWNDSSYSPLIIRIPRTVLAAAVIPPYIMIPITVKCIDSFTVEELAGEMGQAMTVVEKKMDPERSRYTVSTSHNTIRISFNSPEKDISLRLFDLRGNLVADRKVKSGEIAGNVFSWDLDKGSRRIRSGFYLLHLSINGQKKVFSIPLQGR